jgi:hypothetical protein
LWRQWSPAGCIQHLWIFGCCHAVSNSQWHWCFIEGRTYSRLMFLSANWHVLLNSKPEVHKDQAFWNNIFIYKKSIVAIPVRVQFPQDAWRSSSRKYIVQIKRRNQHTNLPCKISITTVHIHNSTPEIYIY